MRPVALSWAAGIAILSATVAEAQHQPYAGLEGRAIKALSEQQVADLKAGRGMGLALAAELNGYPGPIHVLELAEPLGLTEAQRARMQGLYEAMKAEAVSLGERLIAQEADLERQFRERSVSPASLSRATEAIGATQAALRAAHLKHHLSTVEALSPDQVRHYTELRGYGGGTHRPPHGHR
ncbi:MAG TPA: Spy/CpxP family protein refolding chaperone [Beijerinckiaceae bacterium]|jgi:hypothetical protein